MSPLPRPLLSLLAAGALLAASASGASAAPAPTTPPPPMTGPIGAPPVAPTTLPTEWGCFPGRTPNPCEGSLQTTVLSSPQLALRKVARVEDRAPATPPPVDCFYVYPTVTSALGDNAPRRIDADVRSVLASQAAPFSSACRVFAPIYRQASLVSVANSFLTKQTRTSAAQDLAFSDVLGAWKDYLAHDNGGRGVVLVGHSQGAGMLIRLMTTEMENDAATRAKLVGAILPGANLAVKAGERTGGNFETIPTCAAVGETGCATAFSTYGKQPGSSSYFGRIGTLSAAFGGPQGPGLEVACTSPAALAGDGDALHPLLRTALPAGVNGALELGFWNALRPTASTAFVEPGDRFTAACVRENGANVLRLRAGGGSLTPVALPTAEWGLHVGEMGLTMGTLVKLAKTQAAAYVAKRR